MADQLPDSIVEAANTAWWAEYTAAIRTAPSNRQAGGIQQGVSVSDAATAAREGMRRALRLVLAAEPTEDDIRVAEAARPAISPLNDLLAHMRAGLEAALANRKAER